MYEGIVDLSHWNGLQPDIETAAKAGFGALIAKATEGTYLEDPAFEWNQSQAAAAGMLFGAYHFATEGDSVAQADYFLKIANPMQNDLLVLDFEEATQNGDGMSIEDAEAFVVRVFTTLGRWPMLYGGGYLKTLLGRMSISDKAATPLRNCPLWLAEYGQTAYVPTPWMNWTLWQFSDGRINPPAAQVPGIGICDRTRFDGTFDDLKAAWPLLQKPA